MENPYFKYDSRFLRSVFENTFKEHPTTIVSHVKKDLVNNYRLNSMGYRSEEFQAGSDLVTAGCSFTFGSGVPESQRWGSLVASGLGVEETNLGVCAWSTQAIIENIFAYINKYGAPKKIICLFPDPSRSPLSAVEGFLEYEDGFESGRQVVSVMLDRMESYNYSNKPKYSKRPHQINDVIPIELPMYFYFKYIKMLEAYCEALGVDLMWSTWDKHLGEYLEAESMENSNYIHHGFRHYTPLGTHGWGWDLSVLGGGVVSNSLEEIKNCYTGCHTESRDLFQDNFHIGTDLGELVHWGVHKHIHIAEQFLK
jgi:hypothetical protein